MRIVGATLRREDVPLSRAYAVANHSTDTARMLLVRLSTDGRCVGLGAATPEPEVNGDTRDAAAAELASVLESLRGREVAPPEAFAELCRDLRSPGARMALDIALHDLWAQSAGKPLVELLGRVHSALPTSVTLGIAGLDDTLQEAREYLARGFTVLKVKVGDDLEQDLERLVRLRESVGASVRLRIDANVGYRPAELTWLLDATRPLGLEFIEQPLPARYDDLLRALPAESTTTLMADESLHHVGDARRLCVPPRPFGLFNVKLVKCGGIAPARQIAWLADRHGIGLMWGCMDDSRIAIAAALHAACASPATRYLDLDGHLDLSADFATGGFTLEDGVLRLGDGPGLGVQQLADW